MCANLNDISNSRLQSCLALLWSLISFTAYDDTHFPYVATSALDFLFSIPLTVFAAILGGPLGGVTCSVLPVASTENADDLLAVQMNANSSSPSYILFVGNNQTTCFAIMAVWGLIIALCVLFALSGIATGLLFLGKRRAMSAERAATVHAPPAPAGAYPPPSAFSRGLASESEIEMAMAPSKFSRSASDDDDYSSMDSGVHYHTPSYNDAPVPASVRGPHPRLDPANSE